MESTPINYPEMVVEKSKGLTVSEQKLAALGYQTFFKTVELSKSIQIAAKWERIM